MAKDKQTQVVSEATTDTVVEPAAKKGDVATLLVFRGSELEVCIVFSSRAAAYDAGHAMMEAPTAGEDYLFTVWDGLVDTLELFSVLDDRSRCGSCRNPLVNSISESSHFSEESRYSAD